jgi:hypothetical protein
MDLGQGVNRDAVHGNTLRPGSPSVHLVTPELRRDHATMTDEMIAARDTAVHAGIGLYRAHSIATTETRPGGSKDSVCGG